MNIRSNTENTATIAERNDAFRKTLENCTVTRGIASMGRKIHDVYYAVRHYSQFTEDDDPYGEHDFGSFVLEGQKFFWKIDYYDEARKNWCDPLSDECHRHLTIMLAEEY